MAKWKEIPSPEAIVKAALERAYEVQCEWVTESEGFKAIRALASDPAEVAKIIKAAGERHD
jgi:hypothetical protein